MRAKQNGLQVLVRASARTENIFRRDRYAVLSRMNP
jgi:hypothetical protein